MLTLTLDVGSRIIIGDATSDEAIVIGCVSCGKNRARLSFFLPDWVRCDRLNVARNRLEGTGKKLARHIELIDSGDIQLLNQEKKEQ